MARLAGVQIERRGAGGGQRGRDLLADQAALADPGHDHPAATVEQQVDHRLKLGPDALDQ